MGLDVHSSHLKSTQIGWNLFPTPYSDIQSSAPYPTPLIQSNPFSKNVKHLKSNIDYTTVLIQLIL
jgi:hypothetical protein